MNNKEELKTVTVAINRCATVVKGGRRFSFSAVVISGNQNGQIGYGFAKALDVVSCLQKAEKHSENDIIEAPIVDGSVPHDISVKFDGTKLLIKRAKPGTGIIAGSHIRSILELAGYTDVVTKLSGSNAALGQVKAAFKALSKLRTKKQFNEMRGMKPHTHGSEK
tara:strand:- start:106 stop:600 length:495 start_codon:yes stop_codon:yes gene_type:complete